MNSQKREYMKAWRRENAEHIQEYRVTYKMKNTASRIISDAKNRPCTDCHGWFNPWQMEFDHLRDKKYMISGMHCFPIHLIKIEIAKCEVVCSNCHRDRTYKRAVVNNFYKTKELRLL